MRTSLQTVDPRGGGPPPPSDGRDAPDGRPSHPAGPGLDDLLDALHPGRSLKARLGLTFGATALLLSLLLSLVVGRASLVRLEQALGTSLADYAPGLALDGLLWGVALGLTFAALGWGVVAVQLRPLAVMAVAAERMRRGDRSPHIPTGGPDEIGRLAGSLGGLVSALALHEAELTAVNESLEERVRERTHQYADAMRRLEAEIAERRQTEAALRASESEARKLSLVASTTDNAVLITDAAGRTEWVNEGYTRLTGYALEEMLGKRPGEVLQGPETDPDVVQQMTARLAEGEAFSAEVLNYARDGRAYWAAIEMQPIRDELGALTNVVAIQRETTQQKRLEERLYRGAFHDPLTDLPNRTLFMDRLGQAMRRRVGEAGPRFAVLMMDLDRFKVVNDSLGHQAGDLLLTGIARRLEIGLRPVDTVARLGGDEFVVLLDDLEDAADAPRVAERILQELRRPFDLDGHEVFAGASIGIAYGDVRYGQPDEVLRDADVAAYQAKTNGKGRYVIFDAQMRERSVRLLQLETDLRRSLERDQLFLEYLPIVALESGAIVGAAALLRWRHPVRGVLPASEFIPLAEETGLIVPIGEWLAKAACTRARRWHDAGLPLRLSMNLSARQLRQADLAGVVGRALSESGLDPRALDLELTEAAVMAHADEIARQLAALCDLGVRISVDDFGTAYSSLNHLRRLPVHALKIDASLVRDVATDHDDETIVAALIALAHNLNLSVVAEGVETTAQLARLRAHGCDEIQGSVFSRPLSATDLEALVRSGRRLPDVRSTEQESRSKER